MHQWLSFGGSDRAGDVFAKREFSFTLANDIYIRFLSYNSLDDWKADMVKKVPHKIDMGAVYTKEPNQKAYMLRCILKGPAGSSVVQPASGTVMKTCVLIVVPGTFPYLSATHFVQSFL